nr:NADH deshydrogenase subunit 5 [Euceros kiushuensis]
MIFYLYVYIMMIFFFINMILFIYLYFLKMNLFLEFELMNICSMKIEFLFMLDWSNVLFSSVILLISSMVVIYSMEYMILDQNINRFLMMMMFFVMSMLLMILSPNFLSILLGWDGLGLVSYCLIIFYQNKFSYNSGMITVLTNRLGDIMILMIIALLITLGSLNFLFFKKVSNLILILVLISSFTKSAQMPFSYWLPMAMAAPTPVSSLVHSSTLVTAGVYLLIRFNYLMNNSLILKLMMMFSILTLLISSLVASLEYDLKKIIAYSTLSQLSLMIFSLSMKLDNFALFHLLTHAMFKSMLFMCSGIMIHNSFILNQDIRKLSCMLIYMPLVNLLFNCSIFSLCGIPFMAGFYSKDLILEMFMMSKFNMFTLFILFICMGLTLFYSMRLIYYSLFNMSYMSNFHISIYMFKTNMVFSLLILFILSITVGSMLNWFMFFGKNFIIIPMNYKFMIYYFMTLSSLMFLSYSFKNLYKMFSKNKIYFMFNLWFMYNLFNLNFYKSMKFSNRYMYMMEKEWNEYYMSLFMKFLIMYLIKNLFLNYKNYLYLFMFIIYLMIFLY